MSLFSGVDAANTNRLTQFIQLEVPAGASAEELENSELRVFWFRVEGEDLGLLGRGVDPAWPLRWLSPEEWDAYAPNEATVEPAAAPDPGETFPIRDDTRPQVHGGLLLLAQVHGLARALLTAAATGDSLTVSALRELDALIKEHVRPSFGIALPHTRQPLALEYYPRELVSRDQLRAMDSPRAEPRFLANLLLDLRRALLTVPVDGEIPAGGVAACEECGSPFITSRRRQAFCSHRCADTNGQRARRAAKAEKDSLSLKRNDLTECSNKTGSGILTAV